MNRQALILWLPIAALIVASGCTTTPLVGTPAPAPPPAEPPQDETARAPGIGRDRDAAGSPPSGDRRAPGGAAPPEPAMPPAAAALLEQSRGQFADGQYAAAASSIERALRIDPNNAALWVELGEIKLADDDLRQAEQMARKALTLAGGDRTLTAQAERLLARAAAEGS